MIRLATAIDAPALESLYKYINLGGDQPSVSAEHITYMQALPHEKLFVYVLDDKVVGCITAHSCSDPTTAHFFGVISFLSVDPAYRRRGIAEQLLERAEKWCRDRKCHSARLLATAGNEAAIALYTKRGYANNGRIALRKNLRASNGN